ncbi:hypothetical protein EVAR_34598_1 [Eumeta japonica]|uniref:Uncharacterized protein n=1 Tax=Eumeta variegata TaxID=151549 RepID=A0A4C1VG21_EUMVA|nr:hypothetical protein EVAR_34598_1 [Eumeta japonica]
MEVRIRAVSAGRVRTLDGPLDARGPLFGRQCQDVDALNQEEARHQPQTPASRCCSKKSELGRQHSYAAKEAADNMKPSSDEPEPIKYRGPQVQTCGRYHTLVLLTYAAT